MLSDDCPTPHRSPIDQRRGTLLARPPHGRHGKIGTGVAINLFLLGIQLDSLRGFLDSVVGLAHDRLRSTVALAEDGAFGTIDDLEYAESMPTAWIEYASRAVYYELASLVEHYLHNLAAAPRPKSRSNDGARQSESAGVATGDLAEAVMATKNEVSDLDFGETRRLIEARYGLTMRDVDGWAEVDEIRKVVNDLKHRGGYKRLRTIGWKNEGFPAERRLEPEQARSAIDAVRLYFQRLEEAVGE